MKAEWMTKPLGELCEISLGKTPARAKKSYWDQDRLTTNVWLSIADLLDAEGKIVEDSKEYISDEGARLCKRVPKGTLLVSFKLTLGRAAFAGRELFTNEAIAALTLKNGHDVSKEFLFWFIQYFDWDAAAEGDVKVKGKTLNKAKLQRLPVRFPPLPDQQRIVRTLDVAFDSIAKAEANVAVNLANARMLFESYHAETIAVGSGAWPQTHEALANLVELIVDCEHKTAPTQKTGFPSIRTPNVGRGTLILDEVNRVSEQTYREWTRRAVPSAGDLILAREAPAGNVAVIPEGLPLCLGQRTVLIRPRREVFDPEFLALFLLAPPMQARLLAKSRGATVEHVNMSDIRALRIEAIPPVATQKEIVTRLRAVNSETKRLESIYTRKLTALHALKKSLLHQAFTGGL